MFLPDYQLASLTTADGATLHYLTLGRGPWPVVVIPGAGDGQETLDKTAWRLAWHFARRVERYRLLVFSRRQPVPPSFGFERHADDLLWLLDEIEWPPCVLECNSGGGPIGQLAAARRPDRVLGLVLSSSLHRSNPVTSGAVQGWLWLIQQGHWAEFQWSSIELTFRPSTVKRYQLLRPFLRFLAPPPSDPRRIQRVLRELLDFDHSPVLPDLACPALVVGGAQDRIVPAAIQQEMAELIPHSHLQLYPGYGHGNDQENPEYETLVEHFVREVMHLDNPLEP